MAAEDALGLRGFAQIIPQQNSNLYALGTMMARQKQADREFAQKKQQQDLEWFQKESALNFQPMMSELQQHQTAAFKESMGAMTAIYRHASNTGGLTPEHRETISDIKANYDSLSQTLKSLNTDLTDFNEFLKSDKSGTINQGAAATKLKSIIDSSVKVDAQGALSVDPVAITTLKNLKSDPEIYNDAALAKDYVGKLGEISTAQQIERQNSYVTSQQTFTNGLYETNSDGSPKLDSNYGKPIPKASPEAIALWDGQDPNSIEKQKLDGWAKSITPQGKNWQDYRGEAFKRFVVDKFGKYKEDKPSIVNKPEAGLNREEREQQASLRLDTIKKIVFDPHTAGRKLITQTFNPDNNIKAEYTNDGRHIIVSRRDVETNPMNPLQIKRGDWHEYKRIPIFTEQEKEAAIYDINQMLNIAQPANKTIEHGAIQKLWNAENKNKPIDLGF